MNGMYIEALKTGGELVVTKDGWHISYSGLEPQNSEKIIIADRQVGEYINAWCNNYERFAKIKNALRAKNLMGNRKYKEQAQKGMTISIGETPEYDGVWISSSPNRLIVHSESELNDVIVDYNYAARIGEKLMKHMSMEFDEIDEALNNKGRRKRNGSGKGKGENDSFKDRKKTHEDGVYDDGDSDEKALEEWEKGAKYYLGKDGFFEDYAEALKHFKLAIKYGSTDAYSWIGDIYLNGGVGVRKNKSTALKYYKEGINHGDYKCYLGMMSLYLQEGHQENADKCFVNAMKSELSMTEIINTAKEYLFHSIVSHIGNSAYCIPNEAVVLMKPYSNEIIDACENRWKTCNDITLSAYWCEVVGRVKSLF